MRNLLKNRFILSCVILVAAVFFLRPYLTSTPEKILEHRIGGLEGSVSLSVAQTLTLAEALAEAGKTLELSESDREKISEETERFASLAAELKAQLREMPKGAKELSDDARETFNKLQERLTAFILATAQRELNHD